MNDRELKAVEAALDFSKQQTAFASVLVTFTVALSAQLKVSVAWANGLIAISWVLLVISIGAGLLLLGLAAHQLGNEEISIPQLLRESRILAVTQFVLLGFGFGMLLVAVVTGLFR